MEVHHHAHHGKKKWTEYFWEFLMLFLAVTLGFLVENQREHYVENLRAKQFAKTLVEDLAADTVELLDVMKEDRIVLTCCDSLTNWIQDLNKEEKVTGKFYYYCNMGTFSPTVVWTKATRTQITQSGSLRYFGNKLLVKKLSSYYAFSDFITGLNLGDVNYRDESIKIRGRILDNKFYKQYSVYNFNHFNQMPDSLLNVPLPLRTNDPLLLNEFANSFQTRVRLLNLLMGRYYPQALKTASELIDLLKKEYNLK